MLMLIFTYHQVMPGFLDFIFGFGEQQYEEGFHFTGFRQDNRLNSLDRGLSIQDLGWSGRELRLCYSLKSVEPSESQRYWPWSVRTTAVHHGFDIVTGRAVWIVVKGDGLMKSRIKSATGSRGLPGLTSFQTIDRGFASALATHLILCDWSIEHWHRYVSFLEEEFQAASRRTLSVMVSERARAESVANTSSVTDNALGFGPKTARTRMKPSSFMQSPSQPARVLPPVTPKSAPTSYRPNDKDRNADQQAFSFTDLQRLHFLEEKANETLLILKANSSVLTELKHHYSNTADSEDWPQDLKSNCRGDILRFERRVASVQNDLWMQQSRTETLLRLLANRKSLVIVRPLHGAQTTANKTQLFGMLKHHNLEASKELAREAQQSADKMEAITLDMNNIAQKTKQETISMRIITFVTLFFLPGTFISVSRLPLRLSGFEVTTKGRTRP